MTGDLAEALALSDRIGVMFKGRLMALMHRSDQVALNRIPQLMAGLTTDTEDETIHEEVTL